MAMARQPVLIVGAGVAGLVLAQGLRLRSVPFRLFERRPNSLTSQGHRFRLSGEALTAIKTVLSPRLQELFDRTAAEGNTLKPRYVDAQELRFEPPVNAEQEGSKPVDRSWLRALLVLGLEDSIEYCKDFEEFKSLESGEIQVNFTDGTSAIGSLLVGADGVSSKVRKRLQPRRRLLDLERYITWGRTPLTQELRAKLSSDAVSWYMVQDHMSNTQAVIEPMVWTGAARKAARDAGLPCFEDYIYWCICTASSSNGVPQTAAERQDLLGQAIETWHSEVQLVLHSAPHELSACIPVLSSGPDIELGHESALSSRVTIVGDAAHAMSPMGGSGASTAVENAVDLAKTIAEEQDLRMFEVRMANRAKAKIQHSFNGGKKFWKGKEWNEYRSSAA